MADHHVFYVKALPEIRFEDEHFHACFRVGGDCYEFVLRPELFTKGHMLSTEAIAQWQHHSSSANVRRMRHK